MLVIDLKHLDQVKAHATEEYPRECCGIFLGERRGQTFVVERVLRARNLAAAAVKDRYLMDPMDRLRAEAEAKRESLEVIGFYHSHPDHDVYFSKTDVENSEEYLMGEPWVDPTFAYLVMSVKEGQARGFGAFVVLGGKAETIRTNLE
jgi:proteasome lid subunit RPN8/RPN11